MAKFKVGDKARAKKDTPYNITTNGWEGIVKKVFQPNGYSDDLCVKGQGGEFDVQSDYFDLVKPDNKQKVVITSNGKTTTAVLYDGKKCVKTAKAECSPEDTFSLGTGAKLALDRLFEKKADEPQGMDWDAFNRRELSIEVTRDKFEGLMKALEKRGYVMLADGSKPTSVDNPWKVFEDLEKEQDIGGLVMRMLAKELHVEPKEHLYIEVVHDNVICYVWECQDGKLVQEWR